MNTRVDVAVIGGGIAGSLAAWQLARQGLSVALLEKHNRPTHKVCGEFISPEGLPYLAALGVNVDALGAAVISRVRVHGPRHSFEAPLPAAGRGLSRFVLDEVLLAGARQAGAQVLAGQAVRALRTLPHDGGFEADTEGDTIGARTVICATGKFDFKPVQTRLGRDNGLVGFKLHLRLAESQLARQRQNVELFVFQGGYGGTAPLEDGLTNLCFLLRKQHIASMGHTWPDMVARLGGSCRALSACLAGSQPVFWPPVTVANVPYGFLRQEAVAENLYCVGDQLAVIPSFTGEGMTIAMYSAHAAVRQILAAGRGSVEAGSKPYHREMADVLRPQLKAGYRIHRLFKSPGLSDLTTLAARLWPGLVEMVFRQTRSPALAMVSPEPAA